jgi:hypothetical protein
MAGPAQREPPTACHRHVDVRRINLSRTGVRGPFVPDQPRGATQGPRLDPQRRAEPRQAHDPQDLVRRIGGIASAEWIAEHDRGNSSAIAQRVRPRRRAGAAVAERRCRPRRKRAAIKLGGSASSRDHRRARFPMNLRSRRSTGCHQRGSHDCDDAPHPCASYQRNAGPGSGQFGTPCERMQSANWSASASPLPVPVAPLGLPEDPQALSARTQATVARVIDRRNTAEDARSVLTAT